MGGIIASDLNDILVVPLYLALGITVVGLLLIGVGAVMMLRADRPRTRARDAAAPPAKGAWELVWNVVGTFTKWAERAWKLFKDNSRPQAERVIGLGLLLVLIGGLLAIVLVVVMAIASGLGDDGSGSDTTPTTTS